MKVRRKAATLGLLGLAGIAIASAAEPDGKQLFEQRCAMCHGEVGMGTGLLSRRMDPAIAPLEKRTNLPVEYIVKAARMGLGNMPAITRGDVSDLDLARIAAYLAKGPGG